MLLSMWSVASLGRRYLASSLLYFGLGMTLIWTMPVPEQAQAACTGEPVCGGTGYCCGGTTCVPSDYVCCGDGTNGQAPQYQCCGGSPTTVYDTTTQGCCGGAVYNLSTQGCCGGVIYTV